MSFVRAADGPSTAAPALRIGLRALAVGLIAAGLGGLVAGSTLELGGAFAIVGAGVLYLGISALGFRSVVAWILLTLVALPLIRLPRGHPIVTFDRVWVLGMIALLIELPRVSSATPTTRLLTRAFAAFTCAYGLRALFSSGSEMHALGTWIDAILLPFILFAVTRRAATGEDWRTRVAVSFALLGGALGLLAVVERSTGFQLATLSGGQPFIDHTVGIRVSGPFPSPDILALTLLLCLAMSLYWIQLAGKHRLVGVALIALQCAGLALTFFRGAWISAVLIVIITFGLRPRKFARLAGTAFVVLAVAGAVLLESYSSAGVGQRVSNTSNVSSRLATYQQSLRLATREPIFGVGVSQFTLASQGFDQGQSDTVGGVGAIPYAHNSFLFVLVEQGVVGLMPLLVLAVAAGSLGRRLLRAARSRQDVVFAAALVAALTGYLVMSMELTEITALTPNAFLAVLLGLGAARYDAMASHPQETR
jgi:O-antigen ligase